MRETGLLTCLGCVLPLAGGVLLLCLRRHTFCQHQQQVCRSTHRRVGRFPAALWRENRGTSSKPPCCICHRRRFGSFRQKPMVFGFPLRLISNTALLPAFPATGKSGLSETQIVIATTGRRLPVGDKKESRLPDIKRQWDTSEFPQKGANQTNARCSGKPEERVFVAHSTLLRKSFRRGS